MTVHTDESFGIVPLFHDGGAWKVLLIEQISHRGSERRFWTLPKGHSEDGETGEEAAVRELSEETGVIPLRVISDKVFTMEYSFTSEDKMIEKKVHFYIGICDSTLTKITQPDEVAALGWFSFEEAKAKVTHENAWRVLEDVAVYLSQTL